MSRPEGVIPPLFAYERFRFTIKATTFMLLPPYKGAVFRGAFGSAFRRVVCAVPRADCSSCLLRRQCLYVAFFEPPPPPGFPDAAKFSQATPPYVLNPPLTTRKTFHPGELLDFDMVLIGRAIEALPYFIYTFTELGRMGLGSRRGQYELVKVDLLRAEEALTIYEGSTQTLTTYPQAIQPGPQPENGHTKTVTLRFLTPLRLKVKGDLAVKLTFPLFFERLAHRLTLLTAFYNPGAPLPDFEHLQSLAEGISVTADELRWFDWERYSGRQQTTMKFGGIKGRISFAGELDPFLPHLTLGQEINVGQTTSFGLGRYYII